MNGREKPRLEEEIALLRRERIQASRIIEAAINEAFLMPRLDEIPSVETLLEETSRKVRSLIPFKATTFWLVASDGLDFRPALSTPPTWEPFIAAETEALIDDGTVAWALRRNTAVIVSSRKGRENLLLQGLITPDRALGLFAAVLDEDPALLSDLGRTFLTVTLTLTASTLHNLELYRLVSDLNDELKLKVGHLEATERERAAYRLRLEQKVSEKAEENRAKNLFIANVSHEMRSPLNGVLGMAELLADGTLGKEEREQVETIRSEARSLLRLINDVLDFSKLEASRMELESSPFSLRELLTELESSLSPRASRKSLAFRLDIPDEIPDNIVGDRGRLRQVLINLADNALKFTEAGEIGIAVAGEGKRSGKAWVRFTVWDTGIGISEGQKNRLFRDFSQVDAATTRRYGGTGLGLAISKRLVSLMGGSIDCASATGEGSRFFFTIPFSLPEGPSGRGAQNPPAITFSRFPGARILIVDDNAVNRRVAEALTKKLGLFPQTAASAREALDRLGHEPFDLILMDIQMPEMDGLETTRRIRSSPCASLRGIPIIALTAGAFEGDRKGCLEAGMDDYLAKPILPETLRQTIDDTLSARGQRQLPEGTPPIDMALLRRRMGGDDNFCLEIASTFVFDLAERLAEGLEALEARDLKRLRQVAHTLKGAAANSAASSIEEKAIELENRCRAGDLEGVRLASQRLEQESRLLLQWWQEANPGGEKSGSPRR